MTIHKTTRRAMLTTAAAALLASIAGTLPALADAPGADRRLFEIEAEVREIEKRATAAYELYAEAQEGISKWESRYPKPVLGEPAAIPGMGDDLAAIDKYWSVMTAQHVQALKKWNNRCDRARMRLGYAEKESAFNDLEDRMDELCDEAAGIRAMSLESLQCKARINSLKDGHEELVESLLEDLFVVQL